MAIRMTTTKVSDSLLYFSLDHSFMGTNLGARMVAIKLSSGDVWLHSPIPITEAIKKELEALGVVRYIVAPNLFHHLYLKAAHDLYPDATVYAPKGIEKKVKGLTYEPLSLLNLPWADEIKSFQVPSVPAIKETIFYHDHSKSLILTDLFFNVSGNSWWSKLFFTLNGIQDKCATSRLFNAQIKDKVQFKAWLLEIEKLPYRRLIMAHGRVFDR